MNNLFMLDIDTALEIYDLAKARGKKEDDDLQNEFNEIFRKHPEKFKHLGITDMDSQLLKGNLEEEHFKIIDLTKRNLNEQTL